MKPKPHLSGPKLPAYSPRRLALESVLCSTAAVALALAARLVQPANEPSYAAPASLAAAAWGCGMRAFVALKAAKLSGHRWTYAVVAPALAAVVVAVDALTASLLRVLPPPA